MTERPNILLILTDQQRYDTLGVNGSKICLTPHLDSLAKRGVRFTQAYSVTGLCSPARASILTGLYPHKHGMLNNCDMFQAVKKELSEEEVVISDPLRRAGYKCVYVGKWHVGARKGPYSYGFEGMNEPGYGRRYDPPGYQEYLKKRDLKKGKMKGALRGWETRRVIAGNYTGSVETSVPYFLADYTIEKLSELSRGKDPFFLICSFWGPHAPYFPPEPYASMYDPLKIPEWGNFRDDFTKKPRAHRRYRDCFQGENNPPFSWKEWRIAVAKYFGEVTLIDDQIGRVLNALDELNLDRDTVVIFTSDHGDLTGAHGGMKDKGPIMCEEVYHIPFIVRWPKVAKEGGECSQFISNMDLAPTILEIAGVRSPGQMDGRGFVPVLKNPDLPWRQELFAEFHGHRFFISQRMVRFKQYKYIFNACDIDELYDLERDPRELDNQIDDPALSGVVEEMRQRLIQEMKRTKDGMLHHVKNLFQLCRKL